MYFLGFNTGMFFHYSAFHFFKSWWESWMPFVGKVLQLIVKCQWRKNLPFDLLHSLSLAKRVSFWQGRSRREDAVWWNFWSSKERWKDRISNGLGFSRRTRGKIMCFELFYKKMFSGLWWMCDGEVIKIMYAIGFYLWIVRLFREEGKYIDASHI